MANTVAITGKPTKAVKSLATPTRVSGGSYKFEAKVDIGKDRVSKKSNTRATKLLHGWSLGVSLPTGHSTEWQTSKNISDSTTTYTWSLNLNSFNDHTRASFYPLTNVKLTSISLWAQLKNTFSTGPKTTQTRKITPPAAPKMNDFAVTGDSGVVSCVVTSDPGYGHDERYRTRYKMTVYNTRTRQTLVPYDSSSTATTLNFAYDVSDYQQLSYGDYVQITLTAYNQGLAGDSAPVTKTYYMGFPAQTTIKDVSVSSKSATGKLTLAINTNNTIYHPVDKVTLEYLANTTYADASSIPGDAAWTTTNIVDNALCSALSMPVTNLIPDPGKYTWVRVKSEHAIPDVLHRYSEPARIKGLETPVQSAADDEIKIINTTIGKDAQSVSVLMGWDLDGQDDADGTELSWADTEDAWRSTDQPDTFEFDWSDGSVVDTTVTPNVTYPKSATIVIKNLEYGQNVFIRARRYKDVDSKRTFGDYSNAKTQLPSSEVAGEPEGVTFSIPGYIARGGTVTASWDVGSIHEQRSWALVTSTGVNIAYGTGTTNNVAVEASRLEDFAINDVVTLHMEIETGGDPISSVDKSVKIVDRPTLALTVAQTLTAQPLSFTVLSNISCRLVGTITALGVGGQKPGGMYEQYSGDAIWSDEIMPIYTFAPNDMLTTTVTLDGGQPFIDGQLYTLTVQAFDDTTGLSSDAQSAEFAIDWAHQAVPADECIVKPRDYVDDNGVHHISADITIVPPDGATSTDVFDVYRCTGDNAYLIGAGYPSGHVVTDEYSPFGAGMDLFYRIATRTVDGDTEIADIPYVQKARTLRFDWPYGQLELPYNIDIADSYSKNVTFRMHQDGVYNAYWNPGIKRTARHSSQIVRLNSQDDVASARQLARYAGSVFVRTPDGSAFEADVQISDMSTSGVIQAFSLSITEIEPTGTYDLPPYTTDDEQDES